MKGSNDLLRNPFDRESFVDDKGDKETIYDGKK